MSAISIHSAAREGVMTPDGENSARGVLAVNTSLLDPNLDVTGTVGQAV